MCMARQGKGGLPVSQAQDAPMHSFIFLTTSLSWAAFVTHFLNFVKPWSKICHLKLKSYS